MPRKRKPLATQKGNLTVAQQEDKKLEERLVLTGKETLAKPPTWQIDVIGNLDVNNLGCYCNAFSYYISVTKQLKKENKVIKKPTQNGEILVKNPLCDLQKMYSEEMRKFASMCGLTIDSRLKAATIAREGIDNEINDEFGDI